MKFEPVAPEDFPNTKQGRRGRVSYPLLKMFLETGLPVAKLDRTGMQQSLMSLTSCLNNYVKSHDLPVTISQRGGELYLFRTDVVIDENGVPNTEDYQLETDINKLLDKRPESSPVINATPITADEVAVRFEQERGQVGK